MLPTILLMTQYLYMVFEDVIHTNRSQAIITWYLNKVVKVVFAESVSSPEKNKFIEVFGKPNMSTENKRIFA